MSALEVFTEEARNMLMRAERALSPEVMGPSFAAGMRAKLHAQQAEMFKSAGHNTWAPLSEWRIRERGSSTPILVASGSFQRQVMAFHGTYKTDGVTAFTYDYPADEADGRYWGLTAGQKVNPLAKKSRRPGPRGGTKGVWDSPKPLKATPRPILFGEERMLSDSESVIRTFLAGFGIVANEGVSE